MSAPASASASTPAGWRPAPSWHGPSPPAELTNKASNIDLLSQGAEARVWLVTLANAKLAVTGSNGDGRSINGGHKRTVHVGSGIHVPQLHNVHQRPSPLLPQTPEVDALAPSSLKIVCKERFPKKYRHPQLDASLTKSRTKGEARSLIRCKRAGVPCLNVLAIAYWSNNNKDKGSGNKGRDGGRTISSCLFLEYVEGWTVRKYLEQHSVTTSTGEKEFGGESVDHAAKRPRFKETTACGAPDLLQKEDRITTVIDSQTLCVAYSIGEMVAKMHTAGVIHGDLTSSNIMLRNPPCMSSDKKMGNVELGTSSWHPQLVLIDFGLATSTAPTIIQAKGASAHKKTRPPKQQHNAEEKAVDLYVLERAFLSTHPGSEKLVEEIWKGYSGFLDRLDNDNVNGEATDDKFLHTEPSSRDSHDGSENTHARIAKSVLNRLEQVRMRGRKRECFG